MSRAEYSCEWYVRATNLEDTQKCMHAQGQIQLQEIKVKATYEWLQLLLRIIFLDTWRSTPDPRTLMTMVKRKVGVEVSYSTTLRRKHRAIHDLCGTLEEAYNYVFSYLYMLEQLKPGPKKSMLLDGEKRFKYLFFFLSLH